MIAVRVLQQTRKLITYAVTEPGHGHVLRTEVIHRTKDDSRFCRACRTVDSCRHVAAVVRFANRSRLTLI